MPGATVTLVSNGKNLSVRLPAPLCGFSVTISSGEFHILHETRDVRGLLGSNNYLPAGEPLFKVTLNLTADEREMLELLTARDESWADDFRDVLRLELDWAASDYRDKLLETEMDRVEA